MKLIFIFFNSEINTGGHRRYLELAEGLAKRSNNVILIKNSALKLDLPDIKIIDLTYKHRKKLLPHSLYSAWLIKRYKKLLKNEIEKCDFVVIFGETHFFAGCAAKKLFKAKLLFALRSDVITESNFFIDSNKGKLLKQIKYRLDKWKYRIYEKMITRQADLIVFQSSFDRDNFVYRARIQPEKTCVIKNNIVESRFKKEYRHINNSSCLKKVLYIGTIIERKGIQYLLEALHTLEKKNIFLELTLLGKGPLEEEMKKLTVKLGLNQRVNFAGHNSVPFEYMKNHDILVVPSIFDSYPNVILEGLHAGMPVIASRTGGIPDILEDERLLFPPADPQAIADILERLYNSRELYNEYRVLCESYYEKFLFDWPNVWETEMRKRI